MLQEEDRVGVAHLVRARLHELGRTALRVGVRIRAHGSTGRLVQTSLQGAATSRGALHLSLYYYMHMHRYQWGAHRREQQALGVITR